MKPLRVLAIAGCRPNFVKLGPLLAEMRRRPELAPLVVHTGQHYDRELSGLFFRDLELPMPDARLEVGSGSHAVQTARLMEGLEQVMLEQAPDVVLVVGDVNSTLAATLVAAKLGLPVAHVEAGLRSFDREMPEEVNRIVTDALSELLFATEPSAVENLRREGVPSGRIRWVGNVMADALLGSLDKIERSDALERFGLAPRRYAVLTLHRPENVDDPDQLAPILDAVAEIQRALPVLFPVHPRTRARLDGAPFGPRLEAMSGLRRTPPLGYVDFLRLVRDAALVLTDSGGLQEESTVLGVSCLTLRSNTERPATIERGTNRIVGRDPAAIVAAARRVLAGGGRPRLVPDLWDGRAAARIADVLVAEAARLRSLHPALRARTAWRAEPISAA
jgi:UDP-N-acetylglucosamine 2-epimerase (non-hydrolysing)